MLVIALVGRAGNEGSEIQPFIMLVKSVTLIVLSCGYDCSEEQPTVNEFKVVAFCKLKKGSSINDLQSLSMLINNEPIDVLYKGIFFIEKHLKNIELKLVALLVLNKLTLCKQVKLPKNPLTEVAPPIVMILARSQKPCLTVVPPNSIEPALEAFGIESIMSKNPVE